MVKLSFLKEVTAFGVMFLSGVFQVHYAAGQNYITLRFISVCHPIMLLMFVLLLKVQMSLRKTLFIIHTLPLINGN